MANNCNSLKPSWIASNVYQGKEGVPKSGTFRYLKIGTPSIAMGSYTTSLSNIFLYQFQSVLVCVYVVKQKFI